MEPHLTVHCKKTVQVRSELEQGYIEACPNSIISPELLSTSELKRAIRIYERNLQYRQENRLPEIPKEKVDEYESWKLRRQKNSFFELDRDVQETLRVALEKYEEKFSAKVHRLYLAGSYASGSWIRPHSSTSDCRIRSFFKKERTDSDVDLVPEPFLGMYQIGLFDFSLAAFGRRVLIYEDGTFL